MLKISTAVRQQLAVSGSLRDILNNGLIRIYSGPVPASADAALGSAVLLCEISAGGDGTPLTFEETAPNGTLSKSASEVWTGTTLQTGTPSFFRYVLATDTGGASTTEPRIQGSVGGVGSDMVITSLPMIQGNPQAFELFQLTVPEQ